MGQLLIADRPIPQTAQLAQRHPPTPGVIAVLIPCFNEEASLPSTLAGIPNQLFGYPVIKFVADDGSTDQSVQMAQQLGAEVLMFSHAGLAQTFKRGMCFARLGAVCVVVIDADGQYSPKALTALVRPILNHDADLVVCERENHLNTLALGRRLLHWSGAAITRLILGLPLQDPVSGYRAYSPFAAQTLQVQTPYTYTLETLAQVHSLGLRLKIIQAAAHPTARPSRLFAHVGSYVFRQAVTLVQSRILYGQPRQ